MIKNKSKPYLLIFSLLFAHIYSLDYSLQDVNTTSDTYQELVGPSFFIDQGKSISINYFGWEN